MGGEERDGASGGTERLGVTLAFAGMGGGATGLLVHPEPPGNVEDSGETTNAARSAGEAGVIPARAATSRSALMKAAPV